MTKWRVEKCRAFHTNKKRCIMGHSHGMNWIAYSNDKPDVNMWFRHWNGAYSYALVMTSQGY
jgi:hypothetical protein